MLFRVSEVLVRNFVFCCNVEGNSRRWNFIGETQQLKALPYLLVCDVLASRVVAALESGMMSRRHPQGEKILFTWVTMRYISNRPTVLLPFYNALDILQLCLPYDTLPTILSYPKISSYLAILSYCTILLYPALQLSISQL